MPKFDNPNRDRAAAGNGKKAAAEQDVLLRCIKAEFSRQDADVYWLTWQTVDGYQVGCVVNDRFDCSNEQSRGFLLQRIDVLKIELDQNESFEDDAPIGCYAIGDLVTSNVNGREFTNLKRFRAASADRIKRALDAENVRVDANEAVSAGVSGSDVSDDNDPPF